MLPRRGILHNEKTSANLTTHHLPRLACLLISSQFITRSGNARKDARKND